MSAILVIASPPGRRACEELPDRVDATMQPGQTVKQG